MRLHLLHGVERSLTSYNILARECLYALGVGIITALAAICFNYMIHLVQWLCNTMWPQAAWSIPLSVALGGLLVGLLLWWRAKDLNEGGIPGVITSVFAKGGIIPGRVALIRMVTAALTIGSGGSAGREGPIVQIGASLGSKFARVFKLSEHKTILLLACGIAAGISSAFNAPVAGIFFALEIILARFTYHRLSGGKFGYFLFAHSFYCGRSVRIYRAYLRYVPLCGNVPFCWIGADRCFCRSIFYSFFGLHRRFVSSP